MVPSITPPPPPHHPGQQLICNMHFADHIQSESKTFKRYHWVKFKNIPPRHRDLLSHLYMDGYHQITKLLKSIGATCICFTPSYVVISTLNYVDIITCRHLFGHKQTQKSLFKVHVDYYYVNILFRLNKVVSTCYCVDNNDMLIYQFHIDTYIYIYMSTYIYAK